MNISSSLAENHTVLPVKPVDRRPEKTGQTAIKHDTGNEPEQAGEKMGGHGACLHTAVTLD